MERQARGAAAAAAVVPVAVPPTLVPVPVPLCWPAATLRAPTLDSRHAPWANPSSLRIISVRALALGGSWACVSFCGASPLLSVV